MPSVLQAQHQRVTNVILLHFTYFSRQGHSGLEKPNTLPEVTLMMKGRNRIPSRPDRKVHVLCGLRCCGKNLSETNEQQMGCLQRRYGRQAEHPPH